MIQLATKSSRSCPKASDLRLVVVTCGASLDCYLNLEIIATEIILTEEIVGVKLEGVVTRGKIKTKTKKYNVNKTKRKKKRGDFSNQCTVNICPKQKPGLELNVKIFGNGKLVITGGLSAEDAQLAIEPLIKAISPLRKSYTINSSLDLNQRFKSAPDYIKYVKKNYLVLLKLFELLRLEISLNLEIILNKKTVEKYLIEGYETNLNNLDLNSLIKKGILLSNVDLNEYIKVIQVFDICHMYFPNDILLEKLNESGNPLVPLVNSLFDVHENVLPSTFDTFKPEKVKISIENYNTLFNCKFNLDRSMLHQLLNNQYKHVIDISKFDPDRYQGVNTKYISRALCNPNCTSSGGKKNTKCLCKQITFLIFQEGKIMITGGRHWDQIMDGYNVITGILADNYDEISVIKTDSIDKNLDQPPQIALKNSDLVYIHKQHQIMRNPRNYYLLKKLNILEKYF